jgi:hypothetical protein
VNLWATGLGPLPLGVDYDDGDPAPLVEINNKLEILIAGQVLDPSRIKYRGRAPEFAGLDQIQFQPPPGVTGCSIPVALRFNTFVSNIVTMSLGPNRRCSDPLGPTEAEMDRMERGQPVTTGRVELARVDLRVQAKDSSGNNRFPEGTLDVAQARFARYDAAYAPFSHKIAGLPTAGNCIVQYGVTKEPATIDQMLNLTSDPVPHTVLNAGSNLTLTGPGVPSARQVPAPGTGAPFTGDGAMFNTSIPNTYYKLLGADLRDVQFDPGRVDPPFLNGGNVNLQSQGAAGGVGQINQTVSLPASNLEWIDRNTMNSEIFRSQGFTARWRGGDPAAEVAVIYGHSAGFTFPAGTPGASFVCTANIADGQFFVPPVVLQQIPTSKQPMTGIVSVGTAPLRRTGNFSTQGLEFGRFTFSQAAVRNVTYR